MVFVKHAKARGSVECTVVDLGYDDLGRLTSRQASSGESEGFTWKATGLETSIGANGTTSYTHNAEGNLLRIDDPEGDSVTYERDLLGQVTAVHVREYDLARRIKKDMLMAKIGWGGVGMRSA